MAKVNKVTELTPYKKADKDIQQTIQDHFDAQNAAGYNLIAVECFNGSYRFFWEKVT
jgi:hypothetical protein